MNKIRLLLILALAVLPYRPARAQSTNGPQPEVAMPVVCGLVVLGVAAVVVYELHKMCKKIFDAPATPCGCTNGCGCACSPPGPEALYLPTNSPPAAGAARLTDAAGVTVTDVSANGWLDPVSGQPIYGMMQTRLLSSIDLKNWSEEYQIQGWGSDAGILMLYSKNGAPVLTNYLAFASTNAVPLPIGTGAEAAKFYRLATP